MRGALDFVVGGVPALLPRGITSPYCLERPDGPSCILKCFRGRATCARLDPSNREVAVALHLTQGPANLLDQVLVATPFDRTVRKEPHTVLAVGADVVVPYSVGYSRLVRKDQFEGVVEGTNFSSVVLRPQCPDPV